MAKIKGIKKEKKKAKKEVEVKEPSVELPPLKRFSDEPVPKKVRKLQHSFHLFLINEQLFKNN